MTTEITTPHTDSDNADNKPERNPKKLASILMSGAAGIASVLYFGPIAVLGAMVTAVAILMALALVMIAVIVSGYEENLEKMSERPMRLLITIVGWILTPAAVGALVALFAFLMLFAASLPA